MNFDLKRFFKGAARTLIVEPAGERLGIPLWVRGYRRGMWVRYQDVTGILTGIGASNIAEVMLVDAIGENLKQIFVPLSDITRATYEQIPLPRRPTVEAARALGYEVTA